MRFTILSFVVFSLHLIGSTAAYADASGEIAIIIDDFGQNVQAAENMLELDAPFTAAVMPFLEESRTHAKTAVNNGHDVIVHMPMEPVQGRPSWLGPGAITKDMTPERARQSVKQAMDSLPEAKGINNHMGSAIVTNEPVMRSILEEVKERGMYVIDSGTHQNSVVPELCEELAIPYMKRDLFIDTDHSSKAEAINMLEQLQTEAKRNGASIGIGHVGVRGQNTYAALLEMMQKKDFQNALVRSSDMILKNPEHNPEAFWQY
ncbi:hypothetical protein B0H94_10285 [Salsuginibacillus halophilus]|uniref:Divergent polysaccharide deacetylase n=1 Tax=Salsuginibacillus halophilus TaxID=517424 RepID=A0A2P8HX53_9BACI|nr:divergent polysaccharide deacetylase family protein [Salsuginibacillus halophilus]PSL50809.1 hypothetical protein B0H94_10285 [Salsuginibacillus halophilus]